MSGYPSSDFFVDLNARKVLHKPSGIWVSFYEYRNEQDWLASDSVILRDNPDFDGDRMELAAAAKKAALEVGMKARKPELQRT